MRNVLFLFSLMLIATTATAGNFFPPEYKAFRFHEGDLLASQRSNGKFAINKVLKVDRFEFKKGSSINIQGKQFQVTEEDYLLIVSAAYGEAEFNSLEEARKAAQLGKWKVKMGHIPNRPPGATEGQILVGHAPVSESELAGYQLWRTAFEKGEAGVF